MGMSDMSVCAMPASVSATAIIEIVMPRNGPTTAPAAVYLSPSLFLKLCCRVGSLPATIAQVQTKIPASSMRMRATETGFIAVATP